MLLSIFILAAFGALAQNALPTAILGRTYSGPPLRAPATAPCLWNDLEFEFAGGTLPEGVELDWSGVLRGTPRTPGMYRFVAGARNRCGTGYEAYSLLVTHGPIWRAYPELLEFRGRSGAAPQVNRLALSSDWPELAYSIEASDPQVSVRPAGGRTPVRAMARASDVLEVTVNFAGLAPGMHDSWLRVRAWAGDSPRIPIRIFVSPELRW